MRFFRWGLGHLSTLPDTIYFPASALMKYALLHMVLESESNTKPVRRRSGWAMLLVLPYLGLCFPKIYARSLPVLWGFPCFYWYQFGWVIATSMLLGIVYKKLKT
jgi:Protein of unknown function (DUF3311)